MLIKYFLKKWYLVVAYLAVAIATPIIHAKGAFLSGDLLDLAEMGKVQEFFNLLLKFIIFFLAHGVLLFVVQALRTRLVSYCRRDVKRDMFINVMSANNAFFAKPDSGFHIAAFSNDITILESRYFEAFLEFFEGVVSLATILASVFTLNEKLAWIIVIGEAFCVFICLAIRNYSIVKNKIYVERLANFTQRIKDYFSSFQMIQNYSVEKQIKKRFNSMNEETEVAKDDADMSLAFVNRMGNMCFTLIKFVMVGYGLCLVITGEISMGVIFTAYQFSDQLVVPMNTTMDRLNAMESVQSIVKRIKGIAKASKEEKKQEDVVIEEPVTLEIKNVAVEIDGKKILKGVSQTFKSGKKYLIIGRNGAGKSTLLKLLKRSSEDFGGQITVNGVDIRDFSYKSLSGAVSYINEAVPLLCDTVRQNIALYRDVEEERIQEAVQTVGLSVDLDRVIRDGDRNLSSGETRRIEIARSLINRSNVIIYDEAISTLDIPTAYEIEKTLLSLKDQTVIFISHNFSSKLIGLYDEIILLDSGEICGSGRHEELIKTNEYYRRIISIKNG